ncbi:carbohydrate kinase family protein [Streptomyces sp. NPDC058420]|uniref:carbohydrate kinase family protein n=1 Tax=Streptomyces sp. NPDC058420 TaxID=3346489 RepID=UPI00364CFC9A
MRIAVTGSIATDHLTQFPGRFTDQIVPDRLDHVSLSFLVDELHIRRGGVAANIAFGLGQLGLRPLLVGAVGQDFDAYDALLTRHGVDTGAVHRSRTRHTARFQCITDDAGNQIASFYAGAMCEAVTIDIADVARRAGGLDLVLIGADDPDAMLRHTEVSRRGGLAFAADPSQQLARLTGDAIRTLVAGASYLFTNAYESGLLLHKTGWSPADVLARSGTWITTLGEKGVLIRRRGEPDTEISALTVTDPRDPTGVGDGFRAGFLAALGHGMPPARAAQLGCAVAAHVLEAVGAQEYLLDLPALLDRCTAAYGPEARADLAGCLGGTP